MHKTRRWEPVAGLIFCYGNEENGHCACTYVHLTTARDAHQPENYDVIIQTKKYQGDLKNEKETENEITDIPSLHDADCGNGIVCKRM